MKVTADILVALVAAEHAYILFIEMFRWTTPGAQATFSTTPEFAEASKVMAANQGLYNGFLAAGLFWSLISVPHGPALKVFFLSCVLVAGLYGGATVKRSIWLVQALPAALALGALWFAHS